MLGQTVRIAENLWFVQGEMPTDAREAPDWCNVVIYRAEDRLYLIDSSGGAAMRDGIERVLRELGPVASATLINTHCHLDHICNNDLITKIQATTQHHYVLRAGCKPGTIDAPTYFARQFDQMDAFFDPFSSYPVSRITYRMAGWLRDFLGVFLGRERILRWLFEFQFRKFNPVHDSRSTMEALDDTPGEPLTMGGAAWSGWRLGPDDLYVLEARAHADHDVLIYIPEYKMLCMGDVTFALFPTWADSNQQRVIECLRGALAMVRSGCVTLLADGHGHQLYRGRAEVELLLETVLTDHLAFVGILTEIFEATDGLTPAELYEAFGRCRDRPVVAKYLALEFPHTPASLQNVMVTALLQLGYHARGERRRKRFYRPTSASPVEQGRDVAV